MKIAYIALFSPFFSKYGVIAIGVQECYFTKYDKYSFSFLSIFWGLGQNIHLIYPNH